jgi:hypothetical protein
MVASFSANRGMRGLKVLPLGPTRSADGAGQPGLGVAHAIVSCGRERCGFPLAHGTLARIEQVAAGSPFIPGGSRQACRYRRCRPVMATRPPKIVIQVGPLQ